jgi:hypothetical protein
MRIYTKQVRNALGVDWDLSSKEIAIALRNIEKILDDVAERLENDFESAALGDASNLVQVIREGLGA